MKIRTRIGVVALLLGMVVLLFPETMLAQRGAAVSLQSQQGTVALPQLSAPLGTVQQVDEIEPNNTLEQAQRINEASPAIINGMVEVTDEGDPDLDIAFDNDTVDDLEDLFFITTTEAGLNIVLSDFDPADCDLYLFGPDDQGFLDPIPIAYSLNDSPEVIDEPTLPPGPYLIAVAIYDLAPGAASTSYTLTVTGDIATDIQVGGEVPTQFALGQNYPNPFNPATRIQYEVPTNTAVRLEVFNLLGRKVRTLVNEGQAAGTYAVTWDGTTDVGATVATGVYVYRLQAGSFSLSRTMILLQ